MTKKLDPTRFIDKFGGDNNGSWNTYSHKDCDFSSFSIDRNTAKKIITYWYDGEEVSEPNEIHKLIYAYFKEVGELSNDI